ncbi:MAG: hypothetical protein KDD70_13865 [Bdellovibrionales bacterium]|nr:hypothetical protein [Bdellovibrionales bacterium]
MKYLLLFLSVLSFLVLSSCGGGGGNDDEAFSGGARVVISLTPSNIDVGDRTRITIQVFDVNEDGIIVKLNYPDALSYVEETASLEVDGDESDITPDVDVAGDDEDRFLVFFLSEDDFDRDAEGTIRVELQANDSVNDGEISVDIDVDDPQIPNESEFSVDSPQFQPEDTVTIEVDK